MRGFLVTGLFLLLMGLLASPGVAQQPDTVFLQEKLQQVDARIQLKSLQETPLDGIYEALLNTGDLVYISADGQHLLAGNLLAVTSEGLVDLTEQTRSQLRRQELQELPAASQVIFPAKGETKASIQVFTDISCPYCARLHEEVPELNAAGVEVRYLAFPRQGVGSSAYQQLVNVWCAEDQQQAMTKAKAGERIADAQCTNPVEDQFNLARSQGIQGTPAIILPSGQVIPGYLPAQRLLNELNL